MRRYRVWPDLWHTTKYAIPPGQTPCLTYGFLNLKFNVLSLIAKTVLQFIFKIPYSVFDNGPYIHASFPGHHMGIIHNSFGIGSYDRLIR